MANILVLSSYLECKGNALSNSVICLVNTLSKRHNITCITENFDTQLRVKVENAKVIEVPMTDVFNKMLSNGISPKTIWEYRLKSILILWKYPDLDIGLTKRKYNESIKCENDGAHDYVLGFYRAYSNIAVCLKLKKRNKNKKVIAVFLDPLGAYKPFGIPPKIFEKIRWRVERNLLQKLDFCFFPMSIRDEMESKYADFADKIRYFDYPVYKYCGEEGSPKEDDVISFIYAGSLDITYRNPKELINSISQAFAETGKKVRLEFFVEGNCFELLEKMKSEVDIDLVVNHYITKEELLKKYLETDILLNIGNTQKNVVPSKIFELFSYGKPIINYRYLKDDYTNRYFEKYPLALSIDEGKSAIEKQNEIVKFVNDNLGKSANKEELDNLFYENTVEFFSSLFEKIIEEGR